MHLDTNFLIGASQLGSPVRARVEQWLRAGEPLHISAVAWAEFLCGPLRPGEEAACFCLLQTIHSVDTKVATLAARLFNATGRRSRSFPNCLIAATALTEAQPLATENMADFLPFISHGLILA